MQPGPEIQTTMDNEPLSLPCPMCMQGRLRPSRTLYFSISHGQAVCIPDFPAWTCDVCRYSEYDPKALSEWSTTLLSGMAGAGRRSARFPLKNPRHPG